MDVRNRQHHVNLLALGILHGLPDRVDIRTRGPGQRRDHGSFHLARDPLHRLEIAGRRQREAGLDDVDAQERQLARDLELLVRIE